MLLVESSKKHKIGDDMTVEELLKEAEELFERKDFRRLKWVCIAILKEDPDNEAGLTYQAYVYWSVNEPDHVMRIADRILEMNPGSFHSYNLRAMVHLFGHHFESALECCDSGLKISDHYWLRINRIEALICLDRIDEALEYYNASEIPNYRFTYALINCARLSELSQYCDISKDELMDYLFTKKKYIWNRRDVWQFLEGKLENDDEIALSYKAYYVDDEDEIFDTIGKIRRLYPDNYHSYNREAIEYLNRGKFDNALECCDNGLEIRDYPALKISRIEALICLDRTDEAFKFYKASQIPNYNFTKALVRCEKYSQILDYDEGISKEDLVECLLNKCRYMSNGPCPDSPDTKKKKIIKACDEIFKVDNDNEVALGYKAYALMFLQESEEALECCEYAMGIYPDNFRFYYIKAEVLYYELDNLDGAIENYERMVELDINEDIGPFFLVEALKEKRSRLLKSGNYAEAIGCCERILEYVKCNEKGLETLFVIEYISEKHGIEYEPSDNYLKTLEANRQLYDFFSSGIDHYDSGYVERCGKFKNYGSFVDYLRDCLVCIIELCPDADEKGIMQKLKSELSDFRRDFEFETPAYDAAARYVKMYFELKKFAEY